MINFKIKSEFLDKNLSYSVRGVCMIAIIIHHLCKQYYPLTSDSTLLTLLRFTLPWGTYATGVFLFLSGFGLYLSLERNAISVQYVTKHICGLLMPFLIIYAIDTVFSFTLYGFSFEYLSDLVLLRLSGQTTWFIKVILGLYILTFLVFCIFKQRIKTAVMFGACCLYVLVCFLFNVEHYWYYTILCYPVGMFVALYIDRIRIYTSNSKNVFILLCIVWGLFMCFRWLHILPIIERCLFSILVFLFVQFIDKMEFTVLKLIGSKSIYFYLGHFVICYRLFEYCNNPFIIVTMSFVFPYIVSVFVDYTEKCKVSHLTE